MSYVKDHYGSEIEQVFAYVRSQVELFCEPSLHEEIMHHLKTMENSKGVRPALVFAAQHRVDASKVIPREVLIKRAAAVELVHRAALAIDDMIDNSGMRSGFPSLCMEFGYVRAGCAAAELNLLAEQLLDDDVETRKLLREVGHAVAVAEALQDKLSDPHRENMVNIVTWREIAMGDTGSFLRLALELGGFSTRSFTGLEFLKALAYLRHGLDDVEDLIEPNGDRADVKDGVPTLPTCFTSANTLVGLRSAIPECLQELKLYLTLVPNPAFKPFMDDFAEKFTELEQRAIVVRQKRHRGRGRV